MKKITENKVLIYRAKLRLSQAALAEAVGVTQGTISLWEKQKNQPRSSVVIRLLDFLQCTFEDLFKTV